MPADADHQLSRRHAVKTFAVAFNHTFDFSNYAYAVYARLYRGNVGFLPQIYQVRMQARPLTAEEESEEVPDPR